jgi:hypothetical protein
LEAPVPDWRQFFAAAVMTTDPSCIDMVIDEATNALDRRLEELAGMRATEDSRKEREEIIRAAKRLLLLRAQAHECSPEGE